MDMGDSGGGGSKSRFWHVRLFDDGESARLRFLTDADEMYYDWFHKVDRPGAKFPGAGRKICLRSALSAPCDLCDQQVDSVCEWLAWVYVYSYDRNDAGDGREAVKIGKRTVYRETVNRPYLMRYAGMHKAGLKTKFERLGTLLDHDFEWVRAGEKKKPVYTLETLDKSPFPKELAELAATMPDLEDIAFDRPIEPIPTGEAGNSDATFGTPEPKAKKTAPAVAVTDDGDDDEDPFA